MILGMFYLSRDGNNKQRVRGLGWGCSHTDTHAHIHTNQHTNRNLNIWQGNEELATAAEKDREIGRASCRERV